MRKSSIFSAFLLFHLLFPAPDDVQGHLERYYFTGGRLCGVILVGDLSRMADMIKAVEEKRPMDKFFA